MRSAQNWAFCSLFTSPSSLLTVVARFSAPAIAVTLWHFSSGGATAGHPVSGATRKLTLSYGPVSHFFKCTCICARVCLHLHMSACCFMKDDQMTR